MATSIMKSIKGKVVRLTRLDDCGAVVVGSCTTLVSECFISVGYADEIEAGDQFYVKNAWGAPCINDKDPDLTKWVNVSITFAEINPDALDIITSGTPVISGSDTIGMSFSGEQNYNAFALEVWTKNTGSTAACNAGTPEWGYFVVPFIKNGRVNGDITIENGAMTLGITGQGFAAPSTWGVGPYDLNPFVETFPTGDLYGMVVTTVQPPSDTNGCIAYAGS